MCVCLHWLSGIHGCLTVHLALSDQCVSPYRWDHAAGDQAPAGCRHYRAASSPVCLALRYVTRLQCPAVLLSTPGISNLIASYYCKWAILKADLCLLTVKCCELSLLKTTFEWMGLENPCQNQFKLISLYKICVIFAKICQKWKQWVWVQFSAGKFTRHRFKKWSKTIQQWPTYPNF